MISYGKIPKGIDKLYLSGWSIRRIAKKYGVCGNTVMRWFKVNGIQVRQRRYRMLIPKELKKLYLSGESQQKLALKYQVSQGLISKWLRQLKVKTRKDYRGHRHPQWAGGLNHKSDGRVKVWKPAHPRADSGGYVYRQIIVWERYRGKIPEGYLVHHLNGIKDDDRIRNFELMKKSLHSPWLILQVAQKQIRKLEKQIVRLGGKKSNGREIFSQT